LTHHESVAAVNRALGAGHSNRSTRWSAAPPDLFFCRPVCWQDANPYTPVHSSDNRSLRPRSSRCSALGACCKSCDSQWPHSPLLGHNSRPLHLSCGGWGNWRNLSGRCPFGQHIQGYRSCRAPHGELNLRLLARCGYCKGHELAAAMSMLHAHGFVFLRLAVSRSEGKRAITAICWTRLQRQRLTRWSRTPRL